MTVPFTPFFKMVKKMPVDVDAIEFTGVSLPSQGAQRNQRKGELNKNSTFAICTNIESLYRVICLKLI